MSVQIAVDVHDALATLSPRERVHALLCSIVDDDPHLNQVAVLLVGAAVTLGDYLTTVERLALAATLRELADSLDGALH